jgi:tetratricopeptide (TPR) repeat protein
MQEKITLYEEILQQDPGARIFYPLARMYHEIGRSGEALSVLERGLANHPEHLGALLLRIEILDGMGSEKGLSAALGLITILSRTPVLWKLWSEHAGMKGQEDLAVALQFIARSVRGEPLTWSGILAGGLRNMGLLDPKDVPGAPTGTEGAPPSGKGSENDSGASLDFDEKAAPMTPVFEEALTTASETFRATSEQPELLSETFAPEQGMGELMIDADGDEPVVFDFEIMDTEEKSAPETDAPWDIPEPATPDPEPVDCVTAAAEQEVVTTITETAEEILPAETSPEERVERAEDLPAKGQEDDGSPRTRTMADLLAEQGEHERALDIYTELWRSTPPGEERRNLDTLRRAMLAELDRRESSRAAVRKKKEKEELLSVLDGLAKRLEARTSH